MSSQETRDRADVDDAQVTTAADAAMPTAANQTGMESNDDWEAEFEDDLKKWFGEKDASNQKATDSANTDVEMKEEKKEGKKELAALTEKSARSAPPPSSTTFDPFLLGSFAKYPMVTADSVAPATADRVGEVSRLADEKNAMSKNIELLKTELEEEKRLREEAEQNYSVTDLELGIVNVLLDDKTKEAASLGEENQRLRGEQQVWAQERQNFIGEAENLGATISELRAERATNQSLDDLTDRMLDLRIGASDAETIEELESQLDGLSKKMEAARAEGYDAGSQDTRHLAELRHQEVMAEYAKVLDDTISLAERAKKTHAKSAAGFRRQKRESSALSYRTESQHAEQIVWFRSQLAEANRLAAKTTAAKTTAEWDAFLRKEEYAKLDTRLRLAQRQLEQAGRQIKKSEQADKERASRADAQMASLKLAIERERSASSALAADVAKFEARLETERISNEDNGRQIPALTARVEQEKRRREAERMARREYARHTEWLSKQIVQLTAQLAAQRATTALRPTTKELPGPVERRPDRSGLSIFLFGLALFALLLLGAGSLGESHATDMHPCGVEGDLLALCRN